MKGDFNYMVCIRKRTDFGNRYSNRWYYKTYGGTFRRIKTELTDPANTNLIDIQVYSLVSTIKDLVGLMKFINEHKEEVK